VPGRLRSQATAGQADSGAVRSEQASARSAPDQSLPPPPPRSRIPRRPKVVIAVHTKQVQGTFAIQHASFELSTRQAKLPRFKQVPKHHVVSFARAVVGSPSGYVAKGSSTTTMGMRGVDVGCCALAQSRGCSRVDVRVRIPNGVVGAGTHSPVCNGTYEKAPPSECDHWRVPWGGAAAYRGARKRRVVLPQHTRFSVYHTR